MLLANPAVVMLVRSRYRSHPPYSDCVAKLLEFGELATLEERRELVEVVAMLAPLPERTLPRYSRGLNSDIGVA